LRREANGWRVMQESAEGLFAEIIVVTRVKNELMPEIIGDLGGHGHMTTTASEISQEELAQS